MARQVRGLSEKFVDTSELDFKLTVLIVYLCDAMCYECLDKRSRKWIKNM